MIAAPTDSDERLPSSGVRVEAPPQPRTKDPHGDTADEEQEAGRELDELDACPARAGTAARGAHAQARREARARRVSRLRPPRRERREVAPRAAADRKHEGRRDVEGLSESSAATDTTRTTSAITR